MPETLELLIVDDESATRSLLKQIFTQLGHRVRDAADGFSALQLIRESQPDGLLSDLNMPGMSGFELLSVVRRRLPEIYVIATSGAYTGDEVPHGIAADAFYEKASRFQDLLRLMQGAAETVGPPVREARAKAPVWITQLTEDGPGESWIMISCPECLRAFAQEFAVQAPLISETMCVFCGTAIEYAIVQPLDPMTSQPYHPKLVAAVRPLLTAEESGMRRIAMALGEVA